MDNLKKQNNFSDEVEEKGVIDKPTFIISAGFLILFILLALIKIDFLSKMVNAGFAFSVKYFGAYWQILLFFTFIIGLTLAIGRTGSVRLGKIAAPEINSFRWIAIIACTLLAGGGVFWAAGEPIAHFMTPPPLFADTENLYQKAINALAQSFMHWGFLAWAILGSLTSIVFMRLHYDKGLPLKPRTLLYPMFGDKVLKGPWGTIIDSCCIVAVAAGTIGPIGFLGLQISYSLDSLFSIPDEFGTQLIVVLFAIVVYTISALTGLNRGIQILSRFNVILAFLLMIYILIFGPTNFIINGYLQGVGTLVQNFIPMSLFRADAGWLGWWTVFFWGWFLGYGPMMAIFIARISRGRTIREMVLAISVVMPLITYFWFTIVGGSGLAFEIANAGSVSDAFSDGFNLPAALLAITLQLPGAILISILFLILTTIFIATTGDSMTYTIAVVTSGSTKPNSAIRAIWGILMGSVAIILISIGSGGISALQSFIVVTAVPVSLILLPSLWNAPKIAREMAKEQNIIK